MNLRNGSAKMINRIRNDFGFRFIAPHFSFRIQNAPDTAFGALPHGSPDREHMLFA